MDRRRVALLLVVVGMLCLPAPYYLGWAAEATSPPAQTSQIYVADPVNLDNATDREESVFVYHHGEAVTFSMYPLTRPPEGNEYRSPNDTIDALRTAMREGSATVEDAGARADLRAIAADHQFVTDTHDGVDGTYRLSVTENGSDVRASNASDAEIADTIAEQAPHYANLTAGEQRTIDRIMDNSTGEYAGYRPRVNDPYVEQLPTAIHKGDTLYSVYVHGHVDDFGAGFSGFVVGLGVAALGVVLLFIAAVVYLHDRWTDSARE